MKSWTHQASSLKEFWGRKQGKLTHYSRMAKGCFFSFALLSAECYVYCTVKSVNMSTVFSGPDSKDLMKTDSQDKE